MTRITNMNNLQMVKKINETSEQLAEKANNINLELIDKRLQISEKLIVPLGVEPVLPVSNIKILAPLNGDSMNYISGNEAEINGTLVYDKCLFSNGAKINSNQMLKYPLNISNDVKQGTIFLRFKTLIDFNDSLNMEYPIFELVDVDGVGSVSAKFNYLDANNYNGIEVRIRRGTDLQQLVLSNFNFNQHKVYSLAVVWDLKDGEGNGNLAIYINGLIQVATTFPMSRVPKASLRLELGNYPALNRPMQCVCESLLFATEKIETGGILKLHREPLKLEAYFNNYI